MKKVIAIDQGTTSSRVLVLDDQGCLIDKFQKDFK